PRLQTAEIQASFTLRCARGRRFDMKGKALGKRLSCSLLPTRLHAIAGQSAVGDGICSSARPWENAAWQARAYLKIAPALSANTLPRRYQAGQTAGWRTQSNACLSLQLPICGDIRKAHGYGAGQLGPVS